MKKLPFIFVGLVALFAFANSALAAFKVPEYRGYVNDYAGLLTREQRNQLESEITEFEKQTTDEIAIVITNDFQGLDAFTYSQKLFDAWKVGKADKDNGIIIAIGPKVGLPFPDRGDIFIKNGLGLEGVLPDSITGRIVRSDMVPYFQQKQYFTAVSTGLHSVMQVIKGEYTADTSEQPPQLQDQVFGFFTLLFFFGVFIMSYLAGFFARSKSWWAGGVIGAIGGVVLGGMVFTGAYVLIATAVTSILGLLFDYKMSTTYEKRKALGLPTDFWSSGGGMSSGRGWWGGGFGGGGGGGFGGFGGGSSGGGGAGGGW